MCNSILANLFVIVTYKLLYFLFDFCPEKHKTISHLNVTMLFLSSLYALFFPLSVLHPFFFLSFALASVCRSVCAPLYYLYVSQLNNRMTKRLCVYVIDFILLYL